MSGPSTNMIRHPLEKEETQPSSPSPPPVSMSAPVLRRSSSPTLKSSSHSPSLHSPSLHSLSSHSSSSHSSSSLSSMVKKSPSHQQRHSVVGNLNHWIEDQWNINPLSMIQSITSRFSRKSSSQSSTSILSPSSSLYREGSLIVDELSINCEKPVANFLNGTLVATASKELIELAKFGVVELENVEKGVGHKFESFSLPNPTWCDSCGDFMWTPVTLENCVNPSSYFQTVHCVLCKYTCHARCRKLVRIDCQGEKENGTVVKPDPELSSESRLESGSVTVQSEPSVLQEKIVRYNSRLKKKGSGLGITLLESGNFRGFIRVHLNLTRPINVVAGTRPPSIYDIIKEDDESANACRRTLTSFYMPRDTVKNIHITSESTSLEVIKSMLKKFKVVDNPQKFALYQCYPDPDSYPDPEDPDSCLGPEDPDSHSGRDGDPSNNNNQLLKRIGDHDRPLRIALDWLDSDEKKFVLQENDAMDIAWDAFALPELNNFLMILKREEEEHLHQVKLKYQAIKYQLNSILQSKLMIHSDGTFV